MHQHHLYIFALGDLNQLGGRAAAGVNQGALDRLQQGAFVHQGICFTGDGVDIGQIEPLEHALADIHDAFHRRGYDRIDGAQLLVEVVVEGVFDQSLHGAGGRAQVVGQGRCRGEVGRHHHLPGEGHVAPGEVVGLDQGMGDERGLGTPGAIPETEADDGEFVVPHKAGDAVVDN